MKTIYYFYDALCGWCYGFSGVMKELYREKGDEYRFEVISGGMMAGEYARPVGELAGFIRGAHTRVEELSGVTFGESFLEGTLADGKALFDSEPPARALSAFKHFLPQEQVLFAGRIQRAIYYDGMYPDNLEGYVQLAGEFGIDQADYRRRLHAEDTAYAAREEFMFACQLGISGFPAVVLRNEEEEYMLICRGYVTKDELIRKLNGN